MKNKQIAKKILSYIVIYIAMIVVFSVAMIVSYALPNDRIQGHIAESKELLINQNGNPVFLEYVDGAQLDIFTDLLIMNTAMNKGKTQDENILVRAFENSRYADEEDNIYTSMQATIENKDLYNNQEYSRYWHGIQTIIRPLLLFFNYEEIRYILMILIFMLLGITIIKIYKNLSFIHAMAFLASMLAVCIFIVPMSIQYSSIFTITLLSVIIVNWLYEKDKQKFIPYLFFIIGGVTTFFDLLTAPLLTLGIPLIVYVLLKYKSNESIKIKEILTETIKLSLLWGISYAAIFFAKWVIASIVLNRDVITVAINQILFRTKGTEEYPATRLGAMDKNLRFLFNSALIAFTIVTIIIWIIALIRNRNKEINWKKIITLVMISIYPYVWYAIFSGHSTIHAFFTYRIQAITIFGILSAMLECINIEKSK